MTDSPTPPKSANPDVLPEPPRPGMPPSVETDAAETTAAEPGPANGIAVTALVLALMALAGVAWQWFDSRAQMLDTQAEVAKRLAEEGAVTREVRVLAKEAQENAAGAQARVGALGDQLEEFESQQAALEALYQELARNRDEWTLAEVDQLISLAAQQLEVAGNVGGAVLALTHAEARLARAERPQYQSLRRALARDLEQLRGQSAVDLTGLSARLETLVTGADHWPLAFQVRPAVAKPASPAAAAKPAKPAKGAVPAPALAPVAAPELPPLSDNAVLAWLQSRWREVSASSAWQGVAADVWGEVRSLVRIQRFDRPEPVLLAPSQVFFLRENVKLRLLNARLALFTRDTTTFGSELAQTRAAIERHFDTAHPDVAAALVMLNRLGSAEVDVAVPEIQATLAALRTAKMDQEGREPKAAGGRGAQ